MAKSKSKSKSKVDLKQFLLKKGEYVAMGIAGFFLAVLMLWGITKFSNASAKDPDKITKEFMDKSQTVQRQISVNTPTEADKDLAKVPEWVDTPYQFKRAPVSDFALTGPPFDPTAKPDTKKENPNVLPIGTYQVDLTRGSMKGFDIVEGKDGEKIIGVIYDKQIDPQDTEKMRKLVTKFRSKKEPRPVKKAPPTGFPPGNFPGGMGPMAGGFRPGPGPGGMGPMGGMMSGMMNPYGGSEGYDFSGHRVEKSIEYIPISQLDAALKLKKIPAMTVIPVRMVTIHAEIPLKKQIDEIRRALRLRDSFEAARWGPLYDGYEVRRKVSTYGLDGKEEVIQDWADYNFEDEYRTRIAAMRSADHFDEGYLGYFIRYEMALALPLPELVTETGVKYPDIRLKNILETIKKLEEASKKPVEASDILKRIGGGTTRSELYRPQGAAQTGSADVWGADAGGPRMGSGDTPMPYPASGVFTPGQGKMFNPMDANSPNINMPEIEHLLLRFVDAAVEPGMTYQYQIRLRMRNPNYKHTKEVSKPADAEREFLDSPWVQLADAITVPSETFVYAADWGDYSKRIKEEHEKERELRQRLEAKEYQAVVETCTWMEQVRTGDGGKREPVGAWVVADFPVGRGEYVGRKSYVKLPLWSSETKAYVLREIPDKVIPKIPGLKEPAQPKGWLMDFTTNKSILVDFEGGRVRTRVGGREVVEEVATEMLLLRPDGKLIVKRSLDTEADGLHKQIVSDWEKWLKAVTDRKASGSDDPSGFSPRPPGPGN